MTTFERVGFIGLGGMGRNFGARRGEQAHHDLAIDEVLRAAQADEADLGGRGSFRDH